MTTRINLSEVKALIEAAGGAISVIGTCFDRDYLDVAGQGEFPQVWIMGQRLRRRGDGVNSRGYHQLLDVEVAVLCVVKRYADGDNSPEDALTELVGLVVDAIANLKVSNSYSFRLDSIQDGDPSDSVMSAIVVFSTQVAYRGYSP